jgi:hypothetical protein
MRVSPFFTLDEELEKLMVSAPSRFSANSNETRVLVEFSKNKLAMVISLRAGVFFTGPLINVLKLSAVSNMV